MQRKWLWCGCGTPLLLVWLCICAVMVAGAWQIARWRNIPVEAQTRLLQHDGRTRTYNIFVPDNLPSAEVPLLLGLHGGGGDGASFEKTTLNRFNRLAEDHGFIVVYPDGVDEHWNDGRGLDRWTAQRENVDDVGFLAAVVDAVDAEFGIDRTRVYATGISNGGQMCYRLACESDFVTAIAAVDANLSEPLHATCTAPRRIPVMIMYGTNDPIADPDGGMNEVFGTDLGAYLSMADTTAFWTQQQGCVRAPLAQYLEDHENDGTTVTRFVYDGCAQRVDVVAVRGGGHTWPNGFQYLPALIIGRTTRDIDGADVVWEFFATTAEN